MARRCGILPRTSGAEQFIDTPANFLPQVLALAGIQNANELGEYPLDPKQVRDIAALIGFRPDIARFTYHLEPLGLIQDKFRD